MQNELRTKRPDLVYSRWIVYWAIQCVMLLYMKLPLKTINDALNDKPKHFARLTARSLVYSLHPSFCPQFLPSSAAQVIALTFLAAGRAEVPVTVVTSIAVLASNAGQASALTSLHVTLG